MGAPLISKKLFNRGKWTTIYSRFKRWSKAAIFKKIFKIFAKKVNKQCYAMMDSTYIKTHRAASTCACKDKDRKIVISRGGKTSKIHILRNEEGIPFICLQAGRFMMSRRPWSCWASIQQMVLWQTRHMAQRKCVTNWSEEKLKYVSHRNQTANTLGHTIKNYTGSAIKLKIYSPN